MSLIEKMLQLFPEMTATEKTICQGILNNVTLFALKPIGVQAQELSVSTTSLIRFARKLGFDGFSTFKKQLQREEILQTTAADRLQRLKEGDYDHSMQDLKELELNNLEDLVHHVKAEQIRQAVELLSSAKRILLAGIRGQHYLAGLFSYRLTECGFPALLLSQDVMDLREALIGEARDCVLLVFEAYPYSQSLQNLIRCAREKGVSTILFTDYATAPGVDQCTVVFPCSSKTEYYINSLFSPLFLVNVLMSKIISSNLDCYASRLEEREKLQKESQATICG